MGINKYQKEAIIESFAIASVSVYVFLLVTLLAYLFGGGVEKEAYGKVLNFYLPIGAIGLIFMTISKLAEGFLGNDKKYRYINATWHDPEQEGLPFLSSLGFVRSPFKLYLGFFLLSMLLLFGFVNTQQSFAGIYGSVFPQQVSTFANVILNVEPGVLAETLMIGSTYSLLIGFFKWVTIKYKVLNGTYWAFAYLVIVPLTGFLWLAYHNARYGSDNVASGFTLFFGLAGALLTVTFGSVLPFLALHHVNNLFLAMATFVNNDLRIVYVIILFIILLFVFIISLLRNPSKSLVGVSKV